MPAGLDNLKHIVVLMVENRSFDHMLGFAMSDAWPGGNPFVSDGGKVAFTYSDINVSNMHH